MGRSLLILKIPLLFKIDKTWESRYLHFVKNTVIETPRLILRKFDDSDLEALIPIMGDPEVQKFSSFGIEDRDGIQKMLQAVKLREERDGVSANAIILKASGELIGECGISIQEVEGRPEFEIGYKLARLHWGKGWSWIQSA